MTKNSINLEVSHLVKANTLTRTPHREGPSLAAVVKSLRAGPEEQVGLLALTGTGLMTEDQ